MLSFLASALTRSPGNFSAANRHFPKFLAVLTLALEFSLLPSAHRCISFLLTRLLTSTYLSTIFGIYTFLRLFCLTLALTHAKWTRPIANRYLPKCLTVLTLTLDFSILQKTRLRTGFWLAWLVTSTYFIGFIVICAFLLLSTLTFLTFALGHAFFFFTLCFYGTIVATAFTLLMDDLSDPTINEFTHFHFIVFLRALRALAYRLFILETTFVKPRFFVVTFLGTGTLLLIFPHETFFNLCLLTFFLQSIATVKKCNG
mmetsp:Transcript_39131/g.91166  ORF Transcript_39131/g.91166 Transcript_39131/m.91166 type:complete len:258 (+) Transcript_39131:400-1173(+)